MPEVTVFGADRDGRDLLETPSAVTVLDGEDMARFQPSTYEDLLIDMPGLVIQGGRGVAQEPNIRGFTDEQVVIVVDGARQNFNPAHRGRFVSDGVAHAHGGRRPGVGRSAAAGTGPSSGLGQEDRCCWWRSHGNCFCPWRPGPACRCGSNIPMAPQAKVLLGIGYVKRLSAEGILSLAPDLLIAARDAGPDPVLHPVLRGGGCAGP
ncbi:MAG: TonB-dependent receptor plug domain-containing protein [Cyanobacteria bacterium MAG CAR3_bin_5]|nr:TonB-dependent receptor plug domain-containing protein [Cyanobacteria bacterium MAG CAR3_bin_5]